MPLAPVFTRNTLRTGETAPLSHWTVALATGSRYICSSPPVQSIVAVTSPGTIEITAVRLAPVWRGISTSVRSPGWASGTEGTVTEEVVGDGLVVLLDAGRMLGVVALLDEQATAPSRTIGTSTDRAARVVS